MRDVTLKALSFYPVLKQIEIEFIFSEHISKSVMQAQPKFSSMLKGQQNRTYVIKIARWFTFQGERMETRNLPEDVLVGWIGHELGHIMDYLGKSNWGMALYGLAYFTSPGFINSAERAADTFAVSHGLGDYILATKEFILKKAGMPEKYIRKMNKMYLPPEEIIRLMEEKETRDAAVI